MYEPLQTITKKDECRQTEIQIPGSMFKRFITPFVEITLAVGKIETQQLDPLMIIGPKGLVFIAKTVREKGDGEGSVFFINKEITSPVISYICMDYDENFLKFCRSVRVKDKVVIHFDREFYFINATRTKEDNISNLRYSPIKYIYKAKSNHIEDISKEISFSIRLMKEATKRWTAKLTIPAREVKKFYVNVWRFLHRAVFIHKVKDNNAIVAAYSEDALRDLFKESWEEAGFMEPMFATPKRRFFMARQFVNNEDEVQCEGEGEVVLRANWRILKDIAQSGIAFELNFTDFKTPYGFIVQDKQSLFMHICENTFDNSKLVYADLDNTLSMMQKITLDTTQLTKNQGGKNGTSDLQTEKV